MAIETIDLLLAAGADIALAGAGQIAKRHTTAAHSVLLLMASFRTRRSVDRIEDLVLNPAVYIDQANDFSHFAGLHGNAHD